MFNSQCTLDQLHFYREICFRILLADFITNLELFSFRDMLKSGTRSVLRNQFKGHIQFHYVNLIEFVQFYRLVQFREQVQFLGTCSFQRIGLVLGGHKGITKDHHVQGIKNASPNTMLSEKILYFSHPICITSLEGYVQFNIIISYVTLIFQDMFSSENQLPGYIQFIEHVSV